MQQKILNVGQWYTGSSAVLDLLAEHDNIWLLPDNRANKISEFIAYRLAWIDEISRIIDHCSPDRLKLLTNNFNRNIISATFSSSDISANEKQYIKQINEIYIKEVNKIFTSEINNKRIMFENISSAWIDMLCEISDKSHVVFDQPIASYSNPSIYNRVFLNNKIIVTERNILDQITDIQLHSTFFWIVRTGGSITEFIRQSIFERQYWSNQNNQSENILIIKFEDLVLEPENTTQRIFNFLGLTNDKHIHKKLYFKPNESAKNIGKFNNYLSNSEIDSIYSELEKYNLTDLATSIV